jgi:TPR repeat protein
VHTFKLANAIQYLILDDELELDVGTINRAKNNNGQALQDIGHEYANKIKDYSKAMAWYKLAVNQNNTVAYINIGFMYDYGYGVSQDYFIAIEYYLKAARDKNKVAMSNIADLFLEGDGVQLDTYRALEWLSKGGTKPEKVKELNQQGIHLTEEDKSKSFYELGLCY